jgi:hypothetical protein
VRHRDTFVALRIEGHDYCVGRISTLAGNEPVDTIIEATTFSAEALTGIRLSVRLDLDAQNYDGDVQLYLDTGDGVPAYYDISEVTAEGAVTRIVAGEVRCVG